MPAACAFLPLYSAHALSTLHCGNLYSSSGQMALGCPHLDSQPGPVGGTGCYVGDGEFPCPLGGSGVRGRSHGYTLGLQWPEQLVPTPRNTRGCSHPASAPLSLESVGHRCNCPTSAPGQGPRAQGLLWSGQSLSSLRCDCPEGLPSANPSVSPSVRTALAGVGESVCA